MNFYKHHIGDYDAATAHLTWLEDAAYSRLMRLYYRREEPIPADIAAACRLVRAASKAERDAVELVLREFFTLADDGWHNDRCDAEIANAQAKAEKNREVGKAGGRPKKTENHDAYSPETMMVSENNHDGLFSKPTQNPSQTPDSRLQEITEKSGGSPTGDTTPIPFKEIVDAYNATMTRLPKVLRLTDQRKTAIRRAWQSDPKCRSVSEFWQPFFEECESDAFHNGTGPYGNGHANWRPDFDYLIQPKVITKVYERAMQRVEQPNA